MIDPKQAEIMAPAGSFESLAAALQGGCGSVYFGVSHLNMRSRAADNFILEDLSRIVEICRKKNVKTYLALNTLLYDHDMNLARRIVDAAKAEGVDAVIAFDFSVVQYCNQIDMPVHISVQFSVSNYEALKFFASMTNRVVLARELTLDQIRAIYERIIEEDLRGREGRQMEIEAFVHGALCVAQSGRCFMSLYTHNASANRGACLQNCRAKYKVIDEDTGKELILDNHYVMSAADICMIDKIDELLKSGISVFKIEGRGRSPEYVETVTRVYRSALEDVSTGKYTKKKIQMYFHDLEKVFNRKLSHGNYYLGTEIEQYNDSYGSRAKEEKQYLGKVTNYFPKAGVAEVSIESGILKKGDAFIILGATTGVCRGVIQELRNEMGGSVKIARRQIVSFLVDQRVRRKDSVYLIKSR